MLIDLTNKAALITGSTAGVGLAIATGLAHCPRPTCSQGEI